MYIYTDLEFLIEKIDNYKKNLQKSSKIFK